MAKGLVIFATRTNETKKIAELIAEGMRAEGFEADVVSAGAFEGLNLDDYSAFAFGSATYHGDMMQGMKTFLFYAEKADLKDKPGGSFGSYGWSGEAPGRIYDTMANIFKARMAGGPLMLKSAVTESAMELARDYGRDLARMAK